MSVLFIIPLMMEDVADRDVKVDIHFDLQVQVLFHGGVKVKRPTRKESRLIKDVRFLIHFRIPGFCVLNHFDPPG